VFATWLEAGCNFAEAGRRLGVSRQCVHRTIRRYLDGRDLARAAQFVEDERLARRRGRQAYCARRRREERKRAKIADRSGDVSRLPEKALPPQGEPGSLKTNPPYLCEIANAYF
jgi:hypothetical protein